MSTNFAGKRVVITKNPARAGFQVTCFGAAVMHERLPTGGR